VARKTEVKVRITGESRSAEAAAKRTESSYRRLGGFLKNNLLLTLGSVTLATAGLVRGLGSLIRAANKQEDAIRSLDAALLPLGDSAAGVSKRLQEQAAALQKVTTAGDETIIKGQALIASFTKDEEQIKKATAAALDLSAAVGVDLNAAFLLMGKAAAGETTTLSRYGIILDEGVPKQEKFAAALAKVNEQFGGRAQEQAKTFSGQVAQLSNALGDLAERLGEGITQNKRFGDAVTNLTAFVQENEGSIVRLAGAISGVLTEAIGGAVDKLTQLGTAIGTVIVKLQEWTGVNAEAEVSQAALEATAKRLGISVDEVRQQMEDAVGPINQVNTASDKLEKTQGKQIETTEKLTSAQKELKDTTGDAASEMDGYGESLDDVADFSRALIAENARLTQSFRAARAEVNQLRGDFAKMSAARRALGTEGASPNVLGGRSGFATISPGSFTSWQPNQVTQLPDGRLVVTTKGLG
jgi:hypothetical protein